MPPLDLVPVWTIILGVGVFMYVLLDGFDLGIGILFPMARDDDARTLMMNSVAPIWDGNETWLVLGGWGCSRPFRWRSRSSFRRVYFPDAADAARADLPRRRVRVPAEEDERTATGGTMRSSAVRRSRRSRRASCSACTCRASTVTGRAFSRHELRLGAAVSARDRRGTAVRLRAARRDVARDEDGRRAAAWARAPRDDRAVRRARVHRDGEPVDAASARRDRRALVQLAEPALFLRSFRSSPASSPGPRGARCGAIPTTCRSSARWACSRCAISGLGISLFPYVVPYAYTLWQAAAAPSTQAFLLVGTLFLLPIIFMYIGWSYYVFRGKVTSHDGYH